MSKLLKFKKMVWVFIILLLFTGIFTYLQLPKREIPEINVNIAQVSTVYPGSTPEEVERAVINPLESELLDVKGITKVTSASTTGFGSLTATLDGGVNRDSVNSEIRQIVSDVSRSFPDEVQDPTVQTDLTTSSVALYHLVADEREQLDELREDIETWRNSITSLSGVDSILVKGLPERQVTVTLDNEALQENQIAPFSILSTIQKEIAPSAIGTEKNNNTIYQLTFNKYSDIEELSTLSVGNSSDGKVLTVDDVGSIELQNQPVNDIITYKGKPAISLTVFAKEGVNISSLQDALTFKVEELKSELPEGIDVDRFYTQSTIIEEVFTNLVSSLGISFLAVIVIMVLGLPLSSALLVALAIPISIIIGLIPLPYAGVDLNQISVIGMIIAIGILVDDAIVVNDNIQRRFQLGDGPLEGTVRGVKEVAKSIITSTLMIIFSFLPLTFLSGTNGDFIRALPSVLIFTIVASTIISLTLIPTVQYTRKQGRAKKSKSKTKEGLLGGVFNGLESYYADRLLPKTTKRPWVTSILGLVICLLLSTLAIRIPFEFFPSADRQEVTISVEYPQGTPIEETEQHLQSIQQFLIGKEDDITETTVYTGTGLPNIFSSALTRPGENTGQVLVRIDREITSATAFMNKWEEPLRDEFENAEIFLETIVSGPPPSPPVQVQIQGPELDPLISEANELKEQLEGLNPTEIVSLNTTTQPFLQYNPDRDLLAENNIPIDSVTSQIQIANTGVPLGTFDNGVNRLPIKVVLDDGEENGVNLEELQVVSPSSTGAPNQPPSVFTLDEILSVEKLDKIGVIPHLDGERTITVDAYPKEGESQSFTSKTADVIDTFKDELPEGYTILESGETDAQTEFFIEVSKLFVIVLFLIYLTIAVQFNSLLMPLLITGTVFLAITGAIIGLFISGEPLSFLATLGIVSLSGIVVRNSVILIEFMEQNLNHYSSTVVAVIEAGRARIRPIVLTSLTSIAALTPIIFTGDVLFKPLAISIVSGLLFSTVLTLLLVPTFYLIIARVTGRLKA